MSFSHAMWAGGVGIENKEPTVGTSTSAAAISATRRAVTPTAV
ncbi:hypothetical protein [Pengzhenrongella sp.]